MPPSVLDCHTVAARLTCLWRRAHGRLLMCNVRVYSSAAVLAATSDVRCAKTQLTLPHSLYHATVFRSVLRRCTSEWQRGTAPWTRAARGHGASRQRHVL